MESALDHVRAVADAVLYEGYLLYPYRASAAKNQSRWQFGVLTPTSYVDTGTGEHDTARTECLAQPTPESELHLRVRFLQVQRRTVQSATPDGHREADVLELDGEEILPWDEAVEREIDAQLPLAELLHEERSVPITVPGGIETETVHTGRVMRERQPIAAELRCRAQRLPGAQGLVRIHVALANTSTVDCSTMDRAEALRHSLIAAHTVLRLSDGQFVSLLEPPDWAVGHGKQCRNEHTWPVLIGPEDHRETMLSAPIILYDYPKIDPRSQGEFYDACEIDEMLMLWTLTLTEDEKREARATDERARQLMERVHELSAELMERLHGAVSSLDHTRTAGPEPMSAADRPHKPWWEPEEETPRRPYVESVQIGDRIVTRGSRVVLRPTRSGDAQDIFVAGKTATIQDLLIDVDDVRHLAVTVDGDPAAEWQLVQNRFRYFTTDEVEPFGEEATT